MLRYNALFRSSPFKTIQCAPFDAIINSWYGTQANTYISNLHENKIMILH